MLKCLPLSLSDIDQHKYNMSASSLRSLETKTAPRKIWVNGDILLLFFFLGFLCGGDNPGPYTHEANATPQRYTLAREFENSVGKENSSSP